MRPALLAALAPLAVIGLFLLERMNGSAHAVRDAWPDWLPAALALLGALGPALLARGSVTRAGARGLVLAALGGLLTHATLIVLVPLQPTEAASARLWPLLDVLASAGLVAVTALGIRRPWPIVTWVLAAGLLGRSAYNLSMDPAPGAIAGALLWTSAAMLAAALAAARFRLKTVTPEAKKSRR